MATHDERWLLDHLVTLCRDESQLLRDAIGHVTDPRVRTLVAELADQRARFADDLLPHAQRIGGGSASLSEGSWQGALHRRWLAVRDRWLGRSDRAILTEADRDEERAISMFGHALEGGLLSPQARALIETQRAETRLARDRVRSLLAH